jgi:hypothetical protein
MGLCDSRICRKCGTGEEFSVHIFVSVRPWPHSGVRTWVPSFWTRRTLGYWVWGPSGTLVKEQDSYNQLQNMGHKGPALRPR